jgi:hypothetical protein
MDGQNDQFRLCDGSGALTANRVPYTLEFPARDFGEPKRRKILRRCDVYLSQMASVVLVKVYHRPDQNPAWKQWGQEMEIDNYNNYPDQEVAVPHVWTNRLGADFPQIMTFTLPEGHNFDAFDFNISRSLSVGFLHQIKVVITGVATITKMVVYAELLDEEQFANPIENGVVKTDTTGNYIPYRIDHNTCLEEVAFTFDSEEILPGYTIDFGNVPINSPISKVFTLTNSSGLDTISVNVVSLAPGTGELVTSGVPSLPDLINVGDTLTFSLVANSATPGAKLFTLTIQADRADGTPFTFPIRVTFV